MTTKTPWKDIYFIEDGVNPLIKDFIKDNPFKDYSMSCQEESIRWASLLNISFPFMSVEIHHGMFDDDGHTWIEIDGFKFDPTASQFDCYPEMHDYLYSIHDIDELENISELLDGLTLYHGTSSDLWISDDRESDYLFLTIDKKHAAFHAEGKGNDNYSNENPNGLRNKEKEILIEVDPKLLENLRFDYDDDLGNNDSYYDNWVQSFKDIGSFVVFGSIPSSKFKVTNI